MKILNANFFTGKNFILTPFIGAENRFSISCLVCATELIPHMEKQIGWSLNYFEVLVIRMFLNEGNFFI